MTTSHSRVLGIDYGSKRIGLALSDPTRLIAQGAGTVRNDDTILERLARLIDENDVQRIIVGMPYSVDGGKGSKALEVDRFINTLRTVTNVPIETWDESYSSVNAQRTFLQAGMKKKARQQKLRVDEMAARLMLQEYLDSASASELNAGTRSSES